jgi:hypothetical protein
MRRNQSTADTRTALNGNMRPGAKLQQILPKKRTQQNPRTTNTFDKYSLYRYMPVLLMCLIERYQPWKCASSLTFRSTSSSSQARSFLFNCMYGSDDNIVVLQTQRITPVRYRFARVALVSLALEVKRFLRKGHTGKNQRNGLVRISYSMFLLHGTFHNVKRDGFALKRR